MNLTASPVPEFDQASVLIIGDVMLDRYWHGPTSRISPEAPVPVVHVKDVEERPGGAGNVAVNVAALGATAQLVGIVGDDSAATDLEALLSAHRVDCRLQHRAARKTATKLRVISRHQQLIRLDFEDTGQGGALAAEALPAELFRAAGAVVLSDYGKGVLRDMPAFIDAARAAGTPVFIDPKGSDFSRYRGATLITPNLAEFTAVVGEIHDLDDLVSKADVLCRELQLGGLLITRSEQGMTLVQAGQPAVHLPALARDVFDVTGAGDTVIAVIAAAVAQGASLAAAMATANLAAGIVVGKLGTASVSRAELVAATQQQNWVGGGVVDEAGLLAQLQAAREQGQRIVMTNGCFDILHAGHVRYLADARARGDRLVVAVNDDASVQRLKGAGRPINTLSRRMAVLDALASVDWVVPFSEDTPQRLICAALPDVLVKGGDYHPDAIAGGDCVRANGGKVEVLGFVEGCSTTQILDGLEQAPSGEDRT